MTEHGRIVTAAPAERDAGLERQNREVARVDSLTWARRRKGLRCSSNPTATSAIAEPLAVSRGWKGALAGVWCRVRTSPPSNQQTAACGVLRAFPEEVRVSFYHERKTALSHKPPKFGLQFDRRRVGLAVRGSVIFEDQRC
jgi:hypothetical protein